MKIPATFAILIILCLHGEIATQASNAPKAPEMTVNSFNSSIKDINPHNAIGGDESVHITPITQHSADTSVVAEITPVITNTSAADLPTNSTKFETIDSIVNATLQSNDTTTQTPSTTPTPSTSPSTPTTKPTPKPSTTSPTTSPSTPPSTTPLPTTTKVPEPTKPSNVTSSTPAVLSTLTPSGSTPAPQNRNRFDGPSFIGGIVLSLGLVAIGFIGWKYYKARTERNYRTL